MKSFNVNPFKQSLFVDVHALEFIVKPLPTYRRSLTLQMQTTFENIATKGEIAQNKQFLLLPCFQFFFINYTFLCRVSMFSKLSAVCGKGLICQCELYKQLLLQLLWCLLWLRDTYKFVCHLYNTISHYTDLLADNMCVPLNSLVKIF